MLPVTPTVIAMEELGRFMAAASRADDAQQLADLCAAAGARVAGGRPVIVWVGAGEPTGARVGLSGLRAIAPEGPPTCPDLVALRATADGAWHDTDVPGEALGIAPGDPIPHLHSVSVRREDGAWCWIGVVGSDVDLEALRLMAHHLALSVRALAIAREQRATEQRYQALVDQLPAITYYRDLDKPGEATFMSGQLKEMLGYEPSELVADPTFFRSIVHPADQDEVNTNLSRFRADELTQTSSFSYRLVHKDGSTVWVINYVLAVRDDDGRPIHAIGVIFDVTETKQLEEQLRHSQKMEALGRLAGGVAHDFNNLLAVVIGYAALVEESLPDQDELREDVHEIINAGMRGKELVNQLLAFSRRPVAEPKQVDLGPLLDGIRSMISPLVTKNIEFSYERAEDLGFALIDHGQFEQVVTNLLVNAIDAMPDGGKLSVDARPTRLDQMFVSMGGDLAPGDYIVVSVSDTGGGMDAVTQQRMFEPFFTTKPVGKGTGLGLSTAHGIVRQSGGGMWVYSELGRGTTMKVYLPRIEQAGDLAEADATPQVPVGGDEHILIVEDDDALLRMASAVLRKLGYSVSEAENGKVALEVFRSRDDIDLVLTDVVMPRMSGAELVSRLRQLSPGLRCVLMSGYEGDALAYHRRSARDTLILAKPFNLVELSQVVRLALDD